MASAIKRAATMRTSRDILAVIFILLATHSSHSLGDTTAPAAFLPVTPVCAVRVGYAHAVDTYCGQKDLDLKKPHHATAAILDSLGSETILRARLVIWAITDVTFAIALCDRLTSHTKELAIAVQRDTRSELVVDYLIDCAKKKGIPNVIGRYAGLVVGGINSFHPKLVYVETESRRLGFVGSGNVTRSRMNTDYFVRLPPLGVAATNRALSTPSGSHVDWVDCVTKGLTAATLKDTRDEIAEIREQCRVSSVNDETLAFLMPTDSRRALLRLAFLTAANDEVAVLTQGFNSSDINWILAQALRSGKKVRILLDDDIYWAKQDPIDKLMNYAYEYEDYLVPLISSGAEVRFLITNHNEIIGNYQHAKLYAFRRNNAASGVCVLGSANATSSAFTDNVESLIEVDGELCAASLSWFDGLWDRSLPASLMPGKDPLR